MHFYNLFHKIFFQTCRGGQVSQCDNVDLFRHFENIYAGQFVSARYSFTSQFKPRTPFI